MGLGELSRSAMLVAVIALLSSPSPLVAATPGDAFVCYTTARADGQPRLPARSVNVTDEREARDLIVTAPRRLCLPADLGSGVLDPSIGLLGYKARLPKKSAAYAAGNGTQLLNDLGELYVDVHTRPTMLLVPSATNASTDPPAPDPSLHGVDHYRCHKAEPENGAPFTPTQQVAIAAGASTPTRFDLVTLRQVCEPVDAQGLPLKNARNHLACYRARRARGEATYQPLTALRVANQLGTTRIDTGRDVEICLPTRVIDRCNGFSELCDRPFDGVSYPTTHNAMSNVEDRFLGPNQNHSVLHQLSAGVRGLMLDTWYFNGDVVLCHAGDVIPCDRLGMRPLIDTLSDIRFFLEQHPNEIVSIIFESYVSEADTAADFIGSGAIAYTHVQSPTAAWPTVRELIAADTRLVVFTDDSGASLPWHHYVWDYAWETHYSFQQPASFSCNINRGSMSNRLFILNHFLTNVIGSPQLAEMVNHNPLFIDRALQCESESGRLPNFVTVDFYDIGDVFAVVDELNGVAPQ